MTRTEHDDDRLPEPAEGWLKGWPAPSRSSLEWEEAASATMARLRETGLGSTPDDLLAAPLPPVEGERTFELELPGDEPSLADIARKVVESGAALPKDLAREGLLAAQQSRAARPLEAATRSGAPPRRVGAVGHAKASAKPHAPLPVESRPLSAIHVASARSEVPHSEAPRLESSRITSSSTSSRQTLAGIYLGGAALAVAAAALVIVLVRQPELAAPSSLASAENEHDRRPVGASPAPAAEAQRNRPGAAAPEPRRLEELLPMEAPAGRSSAGNAAPRAARKMAPSSANAAPTETLPFHVQPSPKSKVVLSSREAAEPPSAEAPEQQAQAADLSAPSPAQAAAPPIKELLPERPSIGAVQAAVGSVMMGARSCLAGQDTGSQAQVTFGPDGRVRSVAVSGPAAGTPAESCLRSALSAARVAPFSEVTFTASLTVRPP